MPLKLFKSAYCDVLLTVLARGSIVEQIAAVCVSSLVRTEQLRLSKTTSHHNARKERIVHESFFSRVSFKHLGESLGLALGGGVCGAVAHYLLVPPPSVAVLRLYSI